MHCTTEDSHSSSFSACRSKIIKNVLRRTESYSPRRDFVEEKLGSKYVIGRSLDFAVSFEESGPATPMFFILSPGVDPLKDVEKHGNTPTCFIFNEIQTLSGFWTFIRTCIWPIYLSFLCWCGNNAGFSGTGIPACMISTLIPTA